MAVDCMLDDMLMKANPYFIEKAQSFIPKIHRICEYPETFLKYRGDACRDTGDDADGYGKGDVLIWDFGHNHAAYFEFVCHSVGSPMDAPAFLHLKFCETEKELWEDCTEYQGWISKGWIQEEWLHIDELPRRMKMERRYAFRYVKITVLDTSQKFRIVFDQVKRIRVSSVQNEEAVCISTDDKLLRSIDEAALRTLANCMQTVFEDGPKRDRRLWLGDLRLQALTNYKTFRHNDLVKRCLYLFAGMPNKKGMIPACVFERPVPLMDDTFLLDYSLFFLPVLTEYYENTKDIETLRELAPSALRQIELAMEYVDERGVVFAEGVQSPAGLYYCFIDWNESLDKQCAMQAIILYSLRYAGRLCRLLGYEERISYFDELYDRMKTAAIAAFWDETNQVFISGPQRQISAASQVWMILAGVVRGKEAAALLERTKESPVTMVTPYMHHFYSMALIEAGDMAGAISHIKDYWGGMIRAGADTFWELYNPADENESPYGSACVNSYCHAWSCTPAYILRI
ncbi:family 78 glycoside hydrolase catalytic domain [Blautia schinkii]|nr:family 78 glycoside hydrolase catalytic domain [Blautia schinkii]